MDVPDKEELLKWDTKNTKEHGRKLEKIFKKEI